MQGLRIIRWDDLLYHSDDKSCYLIIKNIVYDVTSFLSGSPQNREILLKNVGILNCEEILRNGNEDMYKQIIEENNAVGKLENRPYSEYYRRRIRFLKAEFEQFTIEEISKHNRMQDLWVIIDERVYDLTEYQFIHPGKTDAIHPYAGKDATQKFYEVSKHTAGAIKFKENYFIGRVKR